MIRFSECICGTSKAGPSCCGKGGSWQGKCGRDARFEHTWGDGLKACKGNAAGRNKVNMTVIEEHETLTPQRAAVSSSTIIDVTSIVMLLGFICCLMFELSFSH